MRASKFTVKKIIFDLDGVLYRGHTPIGGAAEAIEKIRSAKIHVSFLTNNATRSRRQLQRRLSKFGIRAKLSEIMTSAFATAHYLNSLKPKPKRIFVVGEKGLRSELHSAGFILLPLTIFGEKPSSTTFSHLSSSKAAKKADILASGLDRKVTYAKLASALEVLDDGAKWVACNMDPTLPMENGSHPGSGAIVAAISYAAGKNPDFVVGKPNLYMLRLLIGKMPKRKSGEILFVGDRLDIDISFANSANLTSILVLSGVSGEKDAKNAKGKLKPDYVLNSVRDLPEFLKI